MKDSYFVRISPTYVAEVDLVDLYDGSWLITRVIVPCSYRGQGYGTKVLELVLKDADELGYSLVLTPNPYPDSPLDKIQLIDWYTRHGFESMAGDSGFALVRPPNPPLGSA